MWQKSGECSTESSSDVPRDIGDSQIFKSNDFVDQNPSCLKLVLYHDVFEVVNPLGSARTRHKVLAVYASVANLPLHVAYGQTQTTCHLFYCAGRRILNNLGMLRCSLNY